MHSAAGCLIKTPPAYVQFVRQLVPLLLSHNLRLDYVHEVARFIPEPAHTLLQELMQVGEVPDVV